MIEPGDIAAQADALERIIRDEPLRARLAAAALDECRRVYSWEAVGAQIVGIYASLQGAQPDLAFEPEVPIHPCRFRAEPHLL